MQVCSTCGAEFPTVAFVDGKRIDLRGRKRCLACVPYRPLQCPRRRVVREVAMKNCERCGDEFPGRMVIDGRLRYLYGRRFCLSCSPFGRHNTSRTPPGALSPDELAEYRRKRRNAKNYRSEKKRRRAVKAELAVARGGRCADCGYAGSFAALDFHHRDPRDKQFAISHFNGSRARLLIEVAKCDLLCATCHRLRHLVEDASIDAGHVVASRRRMKTRAVQALGGACEGCHRTGPAAIFDFHHVDPVGKDFGIGQDGVPRSWAKVLAELAKCVMLCANCHREVHAGVRDLDDGLLGLAEDALPYVA